MARTEGQLRDAVDAAAKEGDRMALIVIDEDRAKVGANLHNQVTCISWCNSHTVPIWIVDLADTWSEVDLKVSSTEKRGVKFVMPVSGTSRVAEPTHPMITNAAGSYSKIIKEGFNAFANTELHGQLARTGRDTLIFIGRYTDSCIRSSILGGKEGGKHWRGAVELGYKRIMTCKDLVHGDTEGKWQDDKGFEWYETW